MNKKIVIMIGAVIVIIILLICIIGVLIGSKLLSRDKTTPTAEKISERPPHYGVYIMQNGDLLELEEREFTGVPHEDEFENLLEIQGPKPVIVFWRAQVNLNYLTLNKLGTNLKKHVELKYNTVPIDGGVLEITPVAQLEAGSYCLIQADAVRVSHSGWCFKINGHLSDAASPTPVEKQVTEEKADAMKPPHYGVYVKQNDSLLELEEREFTGIPLDDEFNNLDELQGSQPVIVFWLQQMNLNYLTLNKLGTNLVKHTEIKYNAVPNEDGIIEITTGMTLDTGSYCLVLADAVRVSHSGWCFKIYNPLSELVTPTPIQKQVAKVGNDIITEAEFMANVRYRNVNYIQTYSQISQYFGDDPSFRQQYQDAIDQLGPNVLEALIEDRLIRQEAARRGITVTGQEVDKAMQAELGYYPEGTPTPKPQPSEGKTTVVATVVQGPTMTPAPTSTPFTHEAYQKVYQNHVDFFASYEITESDLLRIIESQVYREKVQAAILADPSAITTEQEYIWARHILVDSEATADEVINKLTQGGEFVELAKQYSKDTGTSNNGGDLGWFPRGRMVAEFDKAAFALKNIGDFTQQSVRTSFGFHIIQLMGRENRSLSSEIEKFNYWLNLQKQSVEIITSSGRELLEYMPTIYPLPTPGVKPTE